MGMGYTEQEAVESRHSDDNGGKKEKSGMHRFVTLIGFAAAVGMVVFATKAVSTTSSGGRSTDHGSGVRVLAVEPGSQLNGVTVARVDINGEAYDEANHHIPKYTGHAYKDKKKVPHKTPKPSVEQCTQACNHETGRDGFLDQTFFDGMDLTDTASLLQRFQAARQNWIDNHLKVDYGQYYESIFFRDGKSAGKVVFKEMPQLELKTYGHKTYGGKFASPELAPPPGTGWKRLARKFKIKFLQLQLGILKERLGQILCTDRCQKGSRSGTYTKFVWVNGGMSSSAGHGNLHHEAYTAVMEAALFPIFKAVGIDFIARNYAYGGTESDYETSLCSQAIYGRDYDAIVWDFSQTDGSAHYYAAMYGYSAAKLSRNPDEFSQPGNIPHRPALIGMHLDKYRNSVFHELYVAGMTVIGWDEKVSISTGFPDMALFQSTAEIESLPKNVQYFLCHGQKEGGEPGCGAHKWNNICAVGERTGWHPGWKYHAISGHFLATMVLDSMMDALQELVEADTGTNKESLSERHDRIQAQLQKLNLEEKADYDNVLDGPLPAGIVEVMTAVWHPSRRVYIKQAPTPYEADRALALEGIPYEYLLRNHTFCTYSSIPAEIRFKGILLETGNNGDVYRRNFDTGYSKQHVEAVTKNNPFPHTRPGANPDEPPLVTGWDGGDNCEYELGIDHADYWQLSAFDGWRKKLVPNNAEKAYYKQYDPSKANGWIIFCLNKCSWGKCHSGDHHSWLFGDAVLGKPPSPEEFHLKYGTVEMNINGVPVDRAKAINRKCTILTHKGKTREEQYKWEPNKDGQFEFEFRIQGAKEESYLRFTSIILL